MTPEEFRQHGHAVVDWIADYRARVGERPVMAQTAPGEIRAKLPSSPPDAPEPFAAILADLDAIVAPGLTNWQSPAFFGYFPCNGTLASVLGDYVSHRPRRARPVLAVEPGAHRGRGSRHRLAAPDGRPVGRVAGRHPGHGLDLDAAGAHLCAGSGPPTTPWRAAACRGRRTPLVVYTSAHSHSSVDKAALLAGFGRENIRHVACDEAYAMRPEALAAAIDEDRAAGRIPCAVVATTGTTTTTALDPVRAIAAVAERVGSWLHVDAAMAGSAMVLPECRWMWEGVEAADSLVLNPHKWLGAAFDCSRLLRARRRAAGARDVHQSQLPAVVRGRTR